ncbi:MAG: sigma-70 family RNA polymerase sigma factor, partial [Planctomycetes bacterium]|nr:sigma-70 family RNA polymerase sigma factor [Planctomycetota bacterium]
MDERSLERLFECFRGAGDVRALAEVFDRTAPDLLALARHLVRDAAEAEDLVQETFLVAIEKRASFDAEKSLLPWLTGVLVNHARHARRSRTRRTDPERLVERTVVDPADEVAASETRGAIEASLARLPDPYGRVLSLHLLKGLQPREIARELALEPSTTRVQLHRGLELLRKALPAGFALGAAAVVESRGLASVREAVLAKAATVRAVATLPIALVAVIALVVCTLAGVGTWVLRSGGNARTSELTMAADASTNAIEPARAGSGANSSDAVAPASVARESAADPVLASAQNSVRYTGRLTFEGGAPAKGAVVRVSSARRWVAGPADDRELPKDWKEPASVVADDAGRFALRVPIVERLSIDVEAKAPGRAAVTWSWPPDGDAQSIAAKAGDVIDLGDAELVQGGTLVLRVADASGNELDDARWRLSALPLAAPKGRGRVHAIAGAPLDPKTKRARLEDLAPGAYRVSAEHPLTGRIRGANVEVKAGESAEAAITCTVETRGRLVLAVFVEPIRGYVPELERIHLTRPGMEPCSPVVTEGTGSEFAWEGLADGEYALEIDDPRFERFVRPGVRPGERVRAELRGSAALELALTAQGKRIERCKLSVEIDGRTTIYGKDFKTGTWVKREVELQRGPYPLVDGAAPFPTDGLVRGLVPGACVLHLDAPGFPPRRVEVAALRAGETRALAIEFAPDGASKEQALAGVVLGSDGTTPLADVVVTATRGAIAGREGAERGLRTAHVPGRGEVRVPGIDFETRTDGAGRFRFERVLEGEWTVDVAWSPWLESERTVTLGVSASTPLELVQPPSGFLVGTLTAPVGVKATEIDLQLVPRVATQRGDVGGLFRGVPDGAVKADGAFRFGPLPAGELDVSVMDAHTIVDAHSSATLRSMRRIARATIAVGKETRLDLDLSGAIGGKLALAVRVGGKVVEGLTAHVLLPAGPVARLESNCGLSEAGEATLQVPGGDGPFVVAIEGPENGWVWTAPDALAITPAETRALALDVPILTRRVRALDATSGAPLASTRVTWTMRAGET